MKFLVLLAVLVSSLSALSKTQIQCDELSANKYNQHQRFIISLDDANRLETMNSYIWDVRKNEIVGTGSAKYEVTGTTPALSFEAEDGNFIFSFQFQDEDDGAGSLLESYTDVRLILSKSLFGRGVIEIVHASRNLGADKFVTDCELTSLTNQ